MLVILQLHIDQFAADEFTISNKLKDLVSTVNLSVVTVILKNDQNWMNFINKYEKYTAISSQYI